MLYSIRKKLGAQKFNRATASIREKSQVTLDPNAGFSVITLLQDSDVNMYLVAVSSFCHYCPPRRVIVVSDNLSDANQACLRKCIPGVSILPIEDFRLEGLPVGGCWERLACLITHSLDDYVIQLDADTITVQPPIEVSNAISARTSFTLASKPGCEIMTLTDSSELVKDWPQDFVQVLAEKAMKNLAQPDQRLYVRGCAAFTGFAAGSTSLDELHRFNEEMISQLGQQKWSEWGSEQVASNYLVANTDNCRVLPFQKYPYFDPGRTDNEEEVCLYHFLGTHRYEKGKYQKLAKAFIESI